MDVHDNVQKRMLGKEWLAKVDNETSTPYLLKFCTSESELSCSLMITDTKSVWLETLTSNQLARRWRECHPLRSKAGLASQEEELWRRDVLKCLSAAHTIGNFAEMSFDVVESLYSDLAFELHLEDFVFRWETNTAGYRISAEIISRQIIMPLMSTAHLAFSSPTPVGEMSGSDLEMAVDKLSRAARRSPGMHARNTVSRPRLATAIRRMTAMLNFVLDPPIIQVDVEKLDVISPDLTQATTTPEIKIVQHSSAAVDVEMGESAALSVQKIVPDGQVSEGTKSQHKSLDALKAGPLKPKSDDDSATESSDDEPPILEKPSPLAGPSGTRSPVPADKRKADDSSSGSGLFIEAQEPTKKSAEPDSPPPPRLPAAKKTKKAALSSSDSDEGDKLAAGPATRRGARQPIKRGGRRF